LIARTVSCDGGPEFRVKIDHARDRLDQHIRLEALPSAIVDVWVAYHYWKNKFGLDDSNPANGVCFTAGVNNHSRAEAPLYSGISVKF